MADLDMYGERVADASALIHQVSGKEYFDAFGVSTEGILELFIDCMDAVRAIECQAQAGRIAELEAERIQWRNRVVELETKLFSTLELLENTDGLSKNNIQNLAGEMAVEIRAALYLPAAPAPSEVL